MIEDLTRELVTVILKECDRDRNRKRINNVVNTVTSVALSHLHPYLYTIMGILIVMFVMNLFQFYYYVKLFINNNKLSKLHIDDIITRSSVP